MQIDVATGAGGAASEGFVRAPLNPIPGSTEERVAALLLVMKMFTRATAAHNPDASQAGVALRLWFKLPSLIGMAGTSGGVIPTSRAGSLAGNMPRASIITSIKAQAHTPPNGATNHGNLSARSTTSSQQSHATAIEALHVASLVGAELRLLGLDMRCLQLPQPANVTGIARASATLTQPSKPFHVLYLMLAGLPAGPLRTSLHLPGAAAASALLGQDTATLDASMRFEALQSALSLLGMSKDEQTVAVLRPLAAIVALGDIAIITAEVKPIEGLPAPPPFAQIMVAHNDYVMHGHEFWEGFTRDAGATAGSSYAGARLTHAAQLLDVPLPTLVAQLVTRVSSRGSAAPPSKPQSENGAGGFAGRLAVSPMEAEQLRRALIQGIYATVVHNILSVANASLALPKDADWISDCRSLTLLDPVGPVVDSGVAAIGCVTWLP
jgi:hypothetical protein